MLVLFVQPLHPLVHHCTINQYHYYYYYYKKKQDTILLPVTLPNIDRLSEFYHQQTQQQFYNKVITKDPIIPQKRRYATL